MAFSRRILPLDDADEIAALTLQEITEGTRAARASIWLRTREPGLYCCAHAVGAEPPAAPCGAIPDPLRASLAEETRPLAVAGLPGLDPALGSSLPGWLTQGGADLLLPLVVGEDLQGLVCLGDGSGTALDGEWGAEHLTQIGVLAALALSRVAAREPAVGSPLTAATEAYRGRYPVLRDLVGDSAAVLDLYRNLLAVASASCTVLLVGETGSGKELAARILHELSSRHEGPFVEVDCGAIPQDLIESELFGHTRGAFTGATGDRRGVFELADGGTLFLDEVANLPMKTQNRLLRVLQERRFRPVGGEESVQVDVRVVAASNKDLRHAVEEGTFREDLFYRLYVYPIRIPPLRDRAEDIPILAAHYLARCARENRMAVPRMEEGFLTRLQAYAFPGNVRELRHLMERSLLRSGGRGLVTREVLEEAIEQQPAGSEPVSVARAVTSRGQTADATGIEEFPGKAGVERGMWVMEVLRHHRFNVKASAEALTELARREPENPPPLTDRSSLTYYFQVECFRLYLECSGDLEQAARVIAGESDGSVATVRRRLAGYLKSARLVLEDCEDPQTAHRVLREKFLKLPEDYLTVLDDLADHLWAQLPAVQEPVADS